MRIKRQRRKLRGKYSGNCLSCNAKWSKCWYIASEDNQKDWENRLKISVNPLVDEVCFQCWDAKIRTSPKRKIHFKTDPILAENANNAEQLFGGKQMRNKRRSLNPDFEYVNKHRKAKVSRSNMEEKENIQNDNFEENEMERDLEEISIFEEEMLFDENHAVFLLSTAFGKIPIHTTGEISITANGNDLTITDIPMDIKSNDSSPGSFDEFSKRSDDEFGDDMKPKKRGAYYCGKCGKLKKGHVCNIPGADPTDLPNMSSLPDIQSIQGIQGIQSIQGNIQGIQSIQSISSLPSLANIPSLAGLPGIQVQMQVQISPATCALPNLAKFPVV